MKGLHVTVVQNTVKDVFELSVHREVVNVKFKSIPLSFDTDVVPLVWRED